MKQKLIVLLGLPRSGTTLSTAIFDVHPQISAWFEPWHARQKQKPQSWISIDNFKEQYESLFKENVPDNNVLFFKETTTHLEAIDWSEKCIENMIQSDSVDVKIIWLVRDINHAFLSRIHTAKKHWGHDDWEVDQDRFNKFIDFAYQGFKSLEKVTSKYESCLLSYEKLVTDTEQTLKQVMEVMGLDIHTNQLEYHLHLKNNKSAGDPEVTKSPHPINPQKIYDKDEEWMNFREEFLASLSSQSREKYDYMSEIVERVRNKAFIFDKN